MPTHSGCRTQKGFCQIIEQGTRPLRSCSKRKHLERRLHAHLPRQRLLWLRDWWSLCQPPSPRQPPPLCMPLCPAGSFITSSLRAGAKEASLCREVPHISGCLCGEAGPVSLMHQTSAHSLWKTFVGDEPVSGILTGVKLHWHPANEKNVPFKFSVSFALVAQVTSSMV